ncbi:MAG: anti-sigma factor family protein, partial [Bryobacteraceae bacterium]
MNCPTEDVLRRYADREASMPETDEHLRSCERCRKRLGALSERTDRVQKVLGALLPEGESNPDPARAYARLASAIASAEPAPPRRVPFFRRMPVWSAAAACAVILLFTLSPARSWGQRFLSMLRVQKVAIVPVDLQTVTAQLRGSGHQKLIAQFISDNVVVTMKPGAPVTASSPQNASTMAGFPVTTLSALGTPRRISVTGEGAFQMTLDRARIQALFDAAGRSDIPVPASVNGSLVAVHIPKSVHMQYGNCSQKSHT